MIHRCIVSCNVNLLISPFTNLHYIFVRCWNVVVYFLVNPAQTRHYSSRTSAEVVHETVTCRIQNVYRWPTVSVCAT